MRTDYKFIIIDQSYYQKYFNDPSIKLEDTRLKKEEPDYRVSVMKGSMNPTTLGLVFLDICV